MRSIIFLLYVIFFLSYHCFAQFDPLPLKPEQQKRLMEQSQIKDEHLLLAKLEGKWNINFHIPYPGNKDIYGKGVCENTMLMSGKFLKMEQSLFILDTESQTMRIIGYDNFKKKYFMFIIEQENTGSVYCEGDYNKKTNTLTFNGKKYDPLNNKVNDFQIEIFFERENKFVYTNYNIINNQKVMAIKLSFIKEQ